MLVPQEGIEPPTHALRMRCSTPELLRRAVTASLDSGGACEKQGTVGARREPTGSTHQNDKASPRSRAGSELL
jgi:hypothetical protein